MDKKICRVGIIGAGIIAGVMAKTLAEMEDACCYAIASRGLEKAEEFAKQYGVKNAYGSYEELLRDEEVDLVYIATPHSHHYEHMKLTLECNKPILCEKSFTINEKQAKEIFEIAKAKNILVAEAIWTRYLPSRMMIQEVIDKGEIGEVTALSANLGYVLTHVERILKPELAGGALLDVGVYPVNFMSMFLGYDIAEIQSTCVKNEYGVDMQNATTVKYKNGVMATIHSSALAATEQQGIIYGTKGYIIAENINNITEIKVYSTTRELLKAMKAPQQITGFEYQVRSCIRALEVGATQCEEMPHEETLAVMRIMDEMRAQWGFKYPEEIM